MFEKKVEQMRVSTNEEGEILIVQDDPHNEDSVIILQPEQVDMLIGWLKEARESLNQNQG